MFTGYNLKTNGSGQIDFLQYEELGRKHLAEQKVEFEKRIEDYVLNGVADGTQIEKDWFPMIEADIFISHSHSDDRLANGIAGWLNAKFGLKCFIDSCVWNYSDNLLENINSEFSNKRNNPNGGYLYDHEKCNVASKHVNIMLSIALQKMIDKTEVTILLNTKNSISNYGDVYQDATYSPWIYSEIVCTQIVRKKTLSEYRKNMWKSIFEHAEMRGDSKEYNAIYEVSLDHLSSLNEEILLQWEECYEERKIQYPLDYLYKISNPDAMKKWQDLHEGYSFLSD